MIELFVAYLWSVVVMLPVVLLFLFLLARGIAGVDAMLCPQPSPNEDFPWHRCAGPCAWCDYIEDWQREPTPTPAGPYRTHQKSYDRHQEAD